MCVLTVPTSFSKHSDAHQLLRAHRTYHTLISLGKGKSRLQQVIDWCGGTDFDGVVVFDEAHKVPLMTSERSSEETRAQTLSVHCMTVRCENWLSVSHAWW